MQYFPKEKIFIVVVFLSSIVFAVMFLGAPRTITNVSALEPEQVGVYGHSNCADTDRVSSIEWGPLNPGSIESRVVYIRNEVGEPIFFNMSRKNWAPSSASNYITLRWDYDRRRVDPDEVLQIKLTLSISPYITGISNFSFDIYITGIERLLGDVNGDGFVLSDDIIIVLQTENYQQTVPPANPYADVNGDGFVLGNDVITIQQIENYQTGCP